MINEETFCQVVVFDSVVGAVGSSGNYTIQFAVAASLAIDSVVDFCPEFMMKRVTGISDLCACLMVLVCPRSKSC